MKKGNSVKKIGKKASHRKLLMANQLTSLLLSGKIVTTTAKAKVLKSRAQRLMAIGKKKELRDLRRYLRATLKSDVAITNLIQYCAYMGASVGIIKIGYRKGDNAQLSEVVLYDFKEKILSKDKKKVDNKNKDKKKSDGK